MASTREELRAKIQEVPDPVREFFLDMEFTDRNTEIFDKAQTR